MPHLLIAGSTGSGKSVCVNSILLSILYTRTPAEVRLILIDPKQVELSFFEGIPHLLTPVVTDMNRAAKILEWAVDRMEERYGFLLAAGVRNIAGYNALTKEKRAEIRQRDTLTEEGDRVVRESLRSVAMPGSASLIGTHARFGPARVPVHAGRRSRSRPSPFG